jgi:hypothetical protein
MRWLHRALGLISTRGPKKVKEAHAGLIFWQTQRALKVLESLFSRTGSKPHKCLSDEIALAAAVVWMIDRALQSRG